MTESSPITTPRGDYSFWVGTQQPTMHVSLKVAATIAWAWHFTLVGPDGSVALDWERAPTEPPKAGAFAAGMTGQLDAVPGAYRFDWLAPGLLGRITFEATGGCPSPSAAP